MVTANQAIAAPPVEDIAITVESPSIANIPAPPAFLGNEPRLVTSPPEVLVSNEPSPELERPISVQPFGTRKNASRRVILLGVVGLVALIGILIVALRGSTSRAPAALASTPQRLGNASALVADQVKHSPETTNAEPSPTPTPTELAAVAATGSAVATDQTQEDAVSIAINIKPDESVFSYKGRVLGRTPFILKHPRGEKHTYEVGKVGHKTRRVVVTGADKSINFALEQQIPHPDFL